MRPALALAVAVLLPLGLGRALADGTTTRVSVSSTGEEGHGTYSPGFSLHPSISADGRYVAFESAARNFVNGDTNERTDVFVHDRETRQTQRVSVSSAGHQANGNSVHPSISGDGRYVAFESDAPDLVMGDTNQQTDIFVHDRLTGQTERVSVSNAGEQAVGPCDPWHSSNTCLLSNNSSMSTDGRYVAF